MTCESDMNTHDDSLKDRDYNPENENSNSTTKEEGNENKVVESISAAQTSLKKTRWSTARSST